MNNRRGGRGLLAKAQTRRRRFQLTGRERGTVVFGDQTIDRMEYGVALVMSALVVALHVVNVLNAGGLWRDEVVTFSIATMPSLSALWSSIQHDSFPGLFHLVLHPWTTMEWGATDRGLRVFGCLVGIAAAAALWLNAKFLGYRFPLLSLVLLAVSPVTIRYGDSIRAYGLGMLLILLTFGLMWRVLESPSTRRVVLAGFAAGLSVQCLYQNVVLLLAICLGGLAVTVRRRQWERAAVVATIGAGAALSMVLYRGIIAIKQEQKLLIHTRLEFQRLWEVFSQALTYDVVVMKWIWGGLFIAAIAVGGYSCLRRVRGDLSGRDKDVVLFAAVSMVMGVLGFLIFLKVLNFPTQVWYYLPLTALLAVSMDSIFSVFMKTNSDRMLRMVVMASIVGVILAPAWRGVHVRHTNVDLIASKLHESVKSGDLVLVNFWYVGATFQRYYQGPAPWMTLPPHDDLKLQRLDLFKRQMVSLDPIAPVLDQIKKSLESGHRVWLVGGLPFLRKGEEPPSAPPAPHAPWGWDYDAYAVAWSMQAAHLIQAHALRAEQWSPVTATSVSDLENLSVLVVSGWRPGASG